jgi:hypothetical protein
LFELLVAILEYMEYDGKKAVVVFAGLVVAV